MACPYSDNSTFQVETFLGGGWGGGGGSEGYVCARMHTRACVCLCSTIDHSADRQDNSSFCFHQICLLISKWTLQALFTTINQCT